MKMNYKIVEHTFSIGHTIQGAIRQNSEDYISENESRSDEKGNALPDFRQP